MQGNYDAAGPHFYESLQIAEELSLKENNQGSALLMRAVGALATFLLNRNALDDAEPFCIRCLLLAENAYGMDHHKLVEPLRAIAHLREKQGKFEDAANHLKRAFIIVSNIRGLVHQESQRLLDALLRIFNLCGDLKSAETYAILNLESWKEFGPSPTDISVADAKCKLAKLYLETDRPIKAEALLKDALAIQEDKVGPMHADVGETLYMLATCYCKQGRYDKETENYYHRTLEIFEATYGTESPQVGVKAVETVSSNRYQMNSRAPPIPLHQSRRSSTMDTAKSFYFMLHFW